MLYLIPLKNSGQGLSTSSPAEVLGQQVPIWSVVALQYGPFALKKGDRKGKGSSWENTKATHFASQSKPNLNTSPSPALGNVSYHQSPGKGQRNSLKKSLVNDPGGCSWHQILLRWTEIQSHPLLPPGLLDWIRLLPLFLLLFFVCFCPLSFLPLWKQTNIKLRTPRDLPCASPSSSQRADNLAWESVAGCAVQPSKLCFAFNQRLRNQWAEAEPSLRGSSLV